MNHEKKHKFSNVSLIIVSCHSYSDVLQVLVDRLKQIKFLDADFEQVVLATDVIDNSMNFHDYGFTDIVESHGWGSRVRKAVQKLRSEKCVILLDDYIPSSVVNTQKIIDIERHMGDDVDCIYLSAVFDLIKSEDTPIPGFSLLPKEHLYRVNSTASIWRCSSLLKVLMEDDSPWAWEAFAGYRSVARDMKFYAPLGVDSEVYKYSYKTGGCVYRGAWVYDALINCDLSNQNILKLNNRPILYSLEDNKRSLSWKVNFLLTGYKMVGLKVFYFVYFSLKNKLKKIKNKS
jgi:hypothetical protein